MGGVVPIVFVGAGFATRHAHRIPPAAFEVSETVDLPTTQTITNSGDGIIVDTNCHYYHSLDEILTPSAGADCFSIRNAYL
jgi:hypothetical protein